MARSSFLVIFLVAMVLCISYQGYGRRVKVLRHPQEKSLLVECHSLGKRMMQEMTLMDYKEPGPNTNPRSAPFLASPPPSPAAQ